MYLFFKALTWTRLPLSHLPFSSLFLIFLFLKTRSHYTYNWDWPQISKFAVYPEWPPAWGTLPKCCTAVCSTMPSSGSVPPALLLPTVDWLWRPESSPPLSFSPSSVWLYLSIYLLDGGGLDTKMALNTLHSPDKLQLVSLLPQFTEHESATQAHTIRPS